MCNNLVPVTEIYRLTQTQTSSGYSNTIDVSNFSTITVIVDVTAISGAGAQGLFGVDLITSNGNKYDVIDTNAVSTVSYRTFAVGPGTGNGFALSQLITFHWFISGTTPSITFTGYIIAR